MKSLILHIGTHKTGTTSIQRTLHAGRDRLHDHGIHYFADRDAAGVVAPEHHRFAKALATGDVSRVAESLARLDAETPPDGTAILSSESMYRDLLGVVQWAVLDEREPWEPRRRYLAHLQGLFAAYRVAVVVVFRRPDEFAESLYKTLLWGGHTRLTWPEYLAAARFLHDYGRQVDLLRERWADVRVVPYRRQGMVESFFSLIGCPVPAGAEERANRSCDARLISWMAERNRRGRPPHDELARQRAFCGSDLARSLFADEPGVSFWASAAERAAFADPIMQALPAGFFPVVEHHATAGATLPVADHERIDGLYDAWRRECR